ncbi:MAG: glycosyltransferase family 2 protein, partial [Candidatus Binatia bacterium]
MGDSVAEPGNDTRPGGRPTTGPDVSVCIVTYRRPEALSRLLDHLNRVRGLDGMVREIIVVDNDSALTAHETVEAFRGRLPRLLYDREPRRNIAHARNRAISRARGDWIAFIDDDEVPDEDWLLAYGTMRSKSPADGYFGPVWARTESPCPDWLDPRLFLDRMTFPDGAVVDATWTRTANAFVRRSLFATHRFDPAFGITGGSDVELFTRMCESGVRFLFCERAETFEYFPASRLSVRWLLQRSYRGGWVAGRLSRRGRPGVLPRLFRVGRGFAKAGVFVAMLPLEALDGRRRVVYRLRLLAHQLGNVWEAVGRSYEEYARPTIESVSRAGTAAPRDEARRRSLATRIRRLYRALRGVRNRAARLRSKVSHYGRAQYCTVCGSHVRAFLP